MNTSFDQLFRDFEEGRLAPWGFLREIKARLEQARNGLFPKLQVVGAIRKAQEMKPLLLERDKQLIEEDLEVLGAAIPELLATQ